VMAEANPPVKAVGAPYKHLLEDLLAAPQLKDYKLEEAAKLSPEAEGGLNIEGLAATPAGGLLIGFRNPIRRGKALIVPLNNPAGVVEGARADLGDPIELDLEGRAYAVSSSWARHISLSLGPPAMWDRLHSFAGRATNTPILSPCRFFCRKT
jgi:hypothetical protein